jgi:hypothetical protein
MLLDYHLSLILSQYLNEKYQYNVGRFIRSFEVVMIEKNII